MYYKLSTVPLYTTGMNTLKIIGHRGAAGLAPENSIAAIEAGLAAGVSEIEVDLRVTADGVVVLNHDAFITDRDGKKLFICKFSYEALQAHKPNLATLTQAVKAARAVPLLLEIKAGEPPDALISFLQAYLERGHAPAEFAVLSFDQRSLRAVHRALPQIPLVVNERWSGVRARIRADELSTKRINMNARWLWIGFVRAVHRAGYELAPYTVDKPKRIRGWQSYLYGIITNHPERFGIIKP